MKSVFRIYAKTNKSMDPYLHKELTAMGLNPKYEQLLHSFYFNANFHDLFNLSFNSLTVENLYIQVGHKFPMYSQYIKSGRTLEEQMHDYFKKINFKGYFPMQRGLIENITMNLLIRESTKNIPSENAILGTLKNYLNKQIILKEYRQMVSSSGDNSQRLQNYYDIKMIVQKKWQYQDNLRNLRQKQLQVEHKNSTLMLGHGRNIKKSQNLVLHQQSNIMNTKNQLYLPDVPYQPHLMLYIRKNFGRFLLKINKQNLYKHGWKKNVGWAPMRETLTAATLYRAGFIQRLKEEKAQLKLWDPFCGSGTIPLVASVMYSSLPIHKDYTNNFVWPYWPIYKEQYLNEFVQRKKEEQKRSSCQILGSDIDLQSVKYSVENMKKYIQESSFDKKEGTEQFLKIKPVDQIFQLLQNSIYVGCGDFQKLAPTILNNPSKKATIFSNLPYLNTRSKQHHPLNQLTSIYKRFNEMIQKYKDYIENAFVILDSQGVRNPNHFMKFGDNKWRILSVFENGGMEVLLLGWEKNKDGWGKFQIQKIQEKSRSISEFSQQKNQLLQDYRDSMKKLQTQEFKLPKHLADPSKYHGWKRTLQKRRARQMQATYQIFAKQREGKRIFSLYARKQLALRLSRRGRVWKKRSMSMIGSRLPELKEILKKQFESRIEEAVERSQKMKNLKNKSKVQKKW